MTSAVPRLVVDASVAAKWHLPDEDYADQARALLSQFHQGRIRLVAPEQIRYEVPSAITVATRGRAPRLTLAQGRRAIEEFLALDLETVRGDEIVRLAYDIVHEYDCAFYDALYLALAQEMGVPFITADGRLYRRVKAIPTVLWIGDFSAAIA